MELKIVMMRNNEGKTMSAAYVVNHRRVLEFLVPLDRPVPDFGA